MVKKIIKRAIKYIRFLYLSLRKKSIIGAHQYNIDGIFQNKLACASLNAEYEAWADEVFKAIFNVQDGAFLDVGANVGQTLIKVLKIDRVRQYVGFEPQISGCFYIDQFIKKNHLLDHTVFPLGISSRNGVVKLGLRGEDDVTASIVEKYRPEGFYKYYQYIPIVVGDDILNELGLVSVSILKIDVEGGELDVIKGMPSFIKEYMPYIFFEVLPHYLFATQKELDKETKEFRNGLNDEMDLILRDYGYVLYKIIPGEGVLKINKLCAHSREIYYHLAVPSNKEREFLNSYKRVVGGPA